MEVYRCWKQEQAKQEDYSNAASPCTEKVHAVKVQLEFRLLSTVKDNKKGFTSIWKAEGESGTTLVCCLTRLVINRDIDKVKTLKPFSAVVFNTVGGRRCPQSLVLEDHDWGKDTLSVNSKLVQNLLPHLDAHKLIQGGSFQGTERAGWWRCLISLHYFQHLGSLQMSQWTGSWQMMPQFWRRERRKAGNCRPVSLTSACWNYGEG